MDTNNLKETATLGGGCFWCLEPIFEDLQGVEAVVVGYAGGGQENPTYEQVSSGTTGHAEVVQVTFNPRVVSYREILEVFFSVHDPTTRNRQGADAGTQYRSIILSNDARQRKTAEEVIAEMKKEGVWDKPIVTGVVPLQAFYRAEEYHQAYFRKNPYAGYCQMVIRPKVGKFRMKFGERLKSTVAG